MILSDRDFCDNIDAFVDLFKQSFDKEISKEYFIWRYSNKAIDKLLPVNVLVENGVFLANYSANPITLSFKQREFLFLLSMTTMTHPLHEGKGLPFKLGHELYKWAITKGVRGVIGFPNNKIHYLRRLKLAWEDIYEIPMFSLSVNCDLQFNLTTESIVPSRIIDGNIKLPNWINNFFHIKRDTEYLQWRYSEHPHNNYKFWKIENDNWIKSYCVTKEYGDQIDLVEFIPENKKAAQLMLRSIIRFAISGNFSKINSWIQPHMYFRGIFEKYGFINQSPVTYFCGRLFNMDKYNNAGINSCFFDYKNWLIQMGDSDVY